METEHLDIVQQIRKRPGMYLGDPKSNGAVVRMIGELMANVVDLFLIGKASQFSINVDADNYIIVQDDGPGLPFDKIDPESGLNMVEKHLTVGHLPHIHLFSTGVGMVVINASMPFQASSGLRA